MATLLLHHSSFANHQTEHGHPERPDRYRVVQKVLGQPQFDPLVEAKEREIARLRKPVPHVYELVRDSEVSK